MLTKNDDTVVPSIKERTPNNASPKVEKEVKQNIFTATKLVTPDALVLLNSNEISESTLAFLVALNYGEQPLQITVPQKEMKMLSLYVVLMSCLNLKICWKFLCL